MPRDFRKPRQETPKVVEPTVTPQPTGEITLDQVGEKLKTIEDNIFKYAGAEGCNPWLWKITHIDPLCEQVMKNPSQELFAKIMALPDAPVPIV